jgi:hypothetical protein
MFSFWEKLVKESYGEIAILPQNLVVEMEWGKVVAVPLPEKAECIRRGFSFR